MMKVTEHQISTKERMLQIHKSIIGIENALEERANSSSNGSIHHDHFKIAANGTGHKRACYIFRELKWMDYLLSSLR